LLKGKLKIAIDWKSNLPFYHVAENLYLIKTVEGAGDGKSCIEDAFEQTVRDTVVDGKKFNANKKHNASGEYGKQVFTEKVVRANAATINFSDFVPLIDRIVAVVDDYSQRKRRAA
jgi:RNA-directed DNA polymerase